MTKGKLYCMVLSLAAACGHAHEPSSPVVPPPEPNPTLTIFNGASGVDTIETTFATRLDIRVMRGTSPVAGVPVTFTSVHAPGDTNRTRIGDGTSPTSFADTLSATTAADGHAKAAIKLGRVAGEAWVRIRVPSLSLIDSAAYTVLPGHIRAPFAVAPLDTAVYPGTTIKLRITAKDRAGNPATTFHFDPVIGTTSATVATKAGDSIIVAGPAHARAEIQIASDFDLLFQVFRVSIIPRDSLVIQRYNYTPGGVIFDFHVLETDGSHDAVFPKPATAASFLRWLPDGRLLSQGFHMYVLTRNGTVTDLTPTHDVYTFAPDRKGDWVYFSPFDQPGIWRLRPDGSGTQALSDRTSTDVTELDPFAVGNGVLALMRDNALVRFDTLTWKSTPLGISAKHFRLSPAGDRIAFASPDFSTLRVANIDGTGVRDVVKIPIADRQLNWTKDGNFVLVPEQFVNLETGRVGVYSLVRISDGLRLPLAYTQFLAQPSSLSQLEYLTAAIRP